TDASVARVSLGTAPTARTNDATRPPATTVFSMTRPYFYTSRAGTRALSRGCGRHAPLRAAHACRSTQRLERGPHLGRDELRLCPGRVVPPLRRLVVVNEVVVGALHPVPRRLEELVGKHRVADGERHVRRRILERVLCPLCLLPVHPRGRRRGVRQ